MSASAVEAAASTRAERAALVVVLAVLVLLPVGRTSELPILVGAIAGLVLLARGVLAASMRDGAARLATLLFACYWLPVVASGIAAVDPGKTWSTAASTLRFLPFAWFVAWTMRKPSTSPPMLLATAAVVGLWLVDAWVQWIFGYSLGGAPEVERLSGIFGADNLKLGPVLAVLSPFVFVVARSLGGRLGLLGAFAAMLVPVLLSGSRAAWLCFALVVVVFAWRETRSLKRFLPFVAGALVAAVFAVVGAWHADTGFEARIDKSLQALQGTEQSLDEASAGRISIWRTSATMIAQNPLTGVGARGYRHAYLEYAREGDRFAWEGAEVGAYHAHQIVLEVLSETGLVGLAFWIAGVVIAVRAWRRADRAARGRAFAPGLALVAMTFPLNTHLAFYSAWWGLLFWWLLALFVAALGDRDVRDT
ncbi:O-antigen ligase family protein [Dokdonella sp. MW10]|uniref:O-antigen ligase family protein n=1 Tax=Dokdonella sp. MW10 TaxID=2992926 RepID=UPI003F80992F